MDELSAGVSARALSQAFLLSQGRARQHYLYAAQLLGCSLRLPGYSEVRGVDFTDEDADAFGRYIECSDRGVG